MEVQSLVDSSTRPELEERAKELGVTGTSRMNKRQLAEAIVERSDDDAPEGTVEETVEDAKEQGRAELEQLSGGRTISFFGGELPVRALVAGLAFVVVFTVCWMLLWAIFGGVGFGLGWILAAILAAAAVKLGTDHLVGDGRSG